MKTLEQVSEETTWWDEVLVYAQILDLQIPHEHQQDWIETFYENGYTPKQAVDEEMSYNN